MPSLKPYTAYKPVAVPWLHQVPVHWEVLPNRALFAEVNEAGRSEDEMLSVTIGRGVLKQAEHLATTTKKDSSRADKSTYKRVGEGDIVYNKMRAWQGAFGMSRYSGIVSPAYVVQRPRPKAVSEFYHYLMRTPLFAKEAERNSYGLASDIWNLRPEHFKGILNVCPPVAEQHLIVRYLHALDAKVKRYIRTKRTLIARLQEQKQAIIQRAVTRGLDPNVKLNSSGVEWLGEVPANWARRPLKFLSRVIQNGATPPTSERHYYDGGTIPWYGPSSISTGTLSTPVRHLTQSAFAKGKARLIKPPALLVVVIGASAGKMALLMQDAATNQQITSYELREDVVDPRFVLLQLQASLKWLQSTTSTATIPLIDSGILNRLPVVFPSLTEQASILVSIHEETRLIDAALLRAEHGINRLTEYHTRLIADVVTGAVDVREAAMAIAEVVPVPAAEEELEIETEVEEEHGTE